MRAYLPNINQLMRLIFLTIICAAMIAFKYLQLNSSFLMFLGWNIILAWIPLVALSLLSVKSRKRLQSFFSVILWAVWLLFFPNAPYLITDIIHLPKNAILVSSSTLSMNFMAWYDIVLLLLSIWIGILLTFHALYPVHQRISNYTGSILGHLFSLGMCLLSSYGVYLGRFPRLNSWNIINKPLTLYNAVVQSFNLETLRFVLLFGGLIFIIYNTLYSFERR